MNGKQSKKLRKEARKATIGQSKGETKRVYKALKRDYLMSKRYPTLYV